MSRKTTVSKQFTLQWRDVLRGLLMAVVTPALFIIQQSLDRGELIFNWKIIAIASVSGGMAYILKNFLEPTKVITVEKPNKNTY